MSTYIEPATNVSEAWIRTLEQVTAAGGHAVNAITTVTDPLSAESHGIRVAIDSLLVGGSRSGTRIQSVDTVAGTIFPIDLYAYPGYDFHPDLSPADLEQLGIAASDLFESYTSMLAVLTTDTANNRGTYFGRMISWPGKTGNGVNQLADRIASLRRARCANHKKRNLEDIVVSGEAEWLNDPTIGVQVYAASDRRERGFPCLVHIDLTLFEGRLNMSAVYRHQYLVTKAYGNLLGLSQLLGFLAHQTGYQVGELVVNASFADAELGTYSKKTVTEMIKRARMEE